jgi:hypothetical protein
MERLKAEEWIGVLQDGGNQVLETRRVTFLIIPERLR